jgi:hypothetical protein
MNASDEPFDLNAEVKRISDLPIHAQSKMGMIEAAFDRDLEQRKTFALATVQLAWLSVIGIGVLLVGLITSVLLALPAIGHPERLWWLNIIGVALLVAMGLGGLTFVVCGSLAVAAYARTKR